MMESYSQQSVYRIVYSVPICKGNHRYITSSFVVFALIYTGGGGEEEDRGHRIVMGYGLVTLLSLQIHNQRPSLIPFEGVATPSQCVRDSRDSGLKIHGPYGWFSGKCTRFCTHFGLSCGPLDSLRYLDVNMFIYNLYSKAILWLHQLSQAARTLASHRTSALANTKFAMRAWIYYPRATKSTLTPSCR